MICLQDDNVDDDVIFLGTPNVVVAQAPQSNKRDPSQVGHLASSAPELNEEKGKPILNFPSPASSFETRTHSSNPGFPASVSSSETPAFGSDLGFPALGSTVETRAPGSNLGFPARGSTSNVHASSRNRGFPAPGSILNLPALGSNSSANQADAYINLGFSSPDKNLKFITPGNVLTSATQETNLASLHITGVPEGSPDGSSFENNRKDPNFSSIFLGHPAFVGNVNNSDVSNSNYGNSSSDNLSNPTPEYGDPFKNSSNQSSSASAVRLGNTGVISGSLNSLAAGLSAGKPVPAHNYLPEESVQTLQARSFIASGFWYRWIVSWHSFDGD